MGKERKLPQDEARYSLDSPQKSDWRPTCQDCKYFIDKLMVQFNECKKVEGEIDAFAHCKLWKRGGQEKPASLAHKATLR